MILHLTSTPSRAEMRLDHRCEELVCHLSVRVVTVNGVDDWLQESPPLRCILESASFRLPELLQHAGYCKTVRARSLLSCLVAFWLITYGDWRLDQANNACNPVRRSFHASCSCNLLANMSQMLLLLSCLSVTHRYKTRRVQSGMDVTARETLRRLNLQDVELLSGCSTSKRDLRGVPLASVVESEIRSSSRSGWRLHMRKLRPYEDSVFVSTPPCHLEPFMFLLCMH